MSTLNTNDPTTQYAYVTIFVYNVYYMDVRAPRLAGKNFKKCAGKMFDQSSQ